MKKFGIIIDSTVYLSQEQIKENEITVVSLNVVEGDISKEKLMLIMIISFQDNQMELVSLLANLPQVNF